MANQEKPQERHKRFKAMSSKERKALIREKMKVEGLVEGSGVPGKDLSSYDRGEVRDLIKVTSCFPEMQSKRNLRQSRLPNKKKLLAAWILLLIALVSGVSLYSKQYPSLEMRRELSVDGLFWD